MYAVIKLVGWEGPGYEATMRPTVGTLSFARAGGHEASVSVV